jgi:sirohydrochlorin cobaltochelatase
MSEIRNFLARQLARGPWTLGQLRMAPGIVLRHVEDSAPAGRIYERPEDARELAKYDDAGNYRPLKTAPNLRRGWELRLRNVEELHLALDLFYPAALGTWLAFARNELAATPLRATLGRQTGMYRVTQLIRDDQARALIAKMCDEGCLRRRLWDVNSVQSPKSEIENSAILCAEACNLLVAACRPLARENLPKSG